jgi:hypothetical protein
MKYVLFALLAYILYQIIFKLVIPIYMASKKIKKGFGEMQERMQEHMRQQQNQATQANQANQPQQEPKVKAGEYIEFEEVK